MKVKRKTFSGGYRFKNFAGKPKEELVLEGIPERVVIPLLQGFGNEVPPVVKPGESVRAGQIIGIDNDSISNPVHSTVNGVVEKITAINPPSPLYKGGEGGCSLYKGGALNYLEKEIQGVIIKSDGTSDWQTLESRTDDWTKLSGENIEELLYLSGAASLDRGGIPTRYRSSSISPDDVEHIIVCLVNSEVYNPSLRILLGGENISSFIEALRILNKVIPKAEVHLAFDRNEKWLIRQISPLIEGYNWIDLIALEPKYPQELDEIIIPTVLDKPFDYGASATPGLTEGTGVVVLSVQTILHIYEAVVKGKPVIERTVALGGAGFKENLHVRFRIGTSLEYLIKDRIDANKEVRFVLNSPLMGASLSDLSLPLDRQCTSIIALPEGETRQFLTFMRPGLRRDSYSRTFFSSLPIFKKECDTNIHGEERPCISCSFCDEVCPVKIIPHLIHRYVERGIIDNDLMNLKIFNCVECNLCTYVCPSKIPLASFIKEGKEKLIEEGFRDISLRV